MKKQIANELIDFIYESPTAYNAVETLKTWLTKEGFKEIKSSDKWELKVQGKYFVEKNNSGLVAFEVGEGNVAEHGFKLIGAHTDAPGFRIKPSADMIAEKNYMKLNSEVYGGPILNTWFDRPLGLAGRVTLVSENPLKPVSKIININKPVMIIPNVAIHMNRDINNGVKINAQKDTLPLLALVNEEMEKDNFLLNLLASEMNVKVEDILDFELMPYEYQKGSIIGVNEDFISTGRLDNLAMIQAGTKALIDAKIKNGVNVMLCYDNEEVGSRTKQGADSPFFTEVLERIVLSLGGSREDLFRAVANSFLISADLAHAVHPNAGEKHDPIVRPLMGKGPVIKIAASQSYSTDSESAAVYEMICRKAGVPVQRFVNRSDVRGGSTLGPIASSHLAVRTVDMGTAVLAMHSIRELGSVDDHVSCIKSFTEFYNL
ncbi:M18 family aminopeptidase [uncultured Clostridium sp.]|uniref:M18 family aminopeptidase n=1 Tax=uncultured Clostridium sp. TaxID=59620 RepID=UPI00261D1284|nr:M18 family aminopeptidase [uncultured Clostridium sp.]